MKPWEMDWDEQESQPEAAPWEMDWGKEEETKTTPAQNAPTLGAIQGVSFGFADEIGAGMNAAMDYLKGRFSGEDVEFEQIYDRYLTDMRADLVQAREANPAGFVIPEIAGSMATAGGAAKAGLAGAEKVGLGQVLKYVPNWMKFGTTGAVAGGTYSAGTATEGERIDEAQEGALWGAGLGMLSPVLGNLGQGAYKALRRRLTLNRATRDAAEEVARVVQLDELTPERVARNMEKLGPISVLADAGGENLLGLARSVTASPGKAKNLAYSSLVRRQLDRNNRVTDVIEETLGDPQNFALTVEDIFNQRKVLSAPLYKAAHQANIKAGADLVELMKRPSVSQAWADASRLAGEKGVDVVSLQKAMNGEPVDMRTWDFVKQGLDDIINSHKDPKTGRLNNKGQAVLETKREILEILDDLNPTYKEARAVFAGKTESLNALDAGRNFLKEDAEMTAKEVAKLNNSDKEFFRLGAARAVRDKILSAEDGADAYKRIFGNELLREKLRAAFPDDQTFRKFKSQMLKEAKFARTNNVVRGGSPTARIQAESAGFRINPFAAGNLATGNYAFAAMDQLATIMNAKKRGVPQEVKDEIGELLFKSSPEKVRVALRKAWPFLSERERSQLQVMLAAAAGAQQEQIPGRD